MAEATTPEDDFARFRAAGDLRALERVFNHLAPQLLLVAAHVTRDAALAEDLVQTTFLEAIRSAKRWTKGRPLLPWLSGILVHHARNAHRRACRRIEPERLARRRAAAPLDMAAASELATAMSEALAELPRLYRQVLSLRLVHDLQPAQIAHTLGCPPNTVKTRLRRGLDLLRQRLPPGLALPAALVLAQGRGLASVRDAVMHAAASRATVLCSSLPPLPLVLFAGAVVMKKLMAFVVIAVLALIGAFFAVDLHDLGLLGGGATAAEVLPAEQALGASAPPSATEAQAHRLLAPSPTSGLVFTGRCVDAELGSALAECQVSVALSAEARPLAGQLDSLQKTVLGQAATAGDGRFELRCEHRVDSTYLVAIDRHDRLGRRRLCAGVASGQRMDFGDVRMSRGTRVSGRVLDQRGQPIGQVRFRLTRDAQVRFDPLPERSYADVTVDAAGGFVVEQPLTPGSWGTFWFGVDTPVGMPVCIEASTTQYLEIVLPVEDERQTIHGDVADTSGAPIPNLWIAATGGGTYGNAQTAADGSFAIFRRGPYDAEARRPVEITLKDRSERWELAAGALTSEWGARRLRVVVQPAAQAIVRPIDARTGKLLHDYELRVAAAVVSEGREVLQAYLPESVRQTSGETLLRALRRGTHVVRVEPRDPALAASELVRFEARVAEGQAIVVELRPPIELPVLVVDATGAPVAGTRLQLFQAFAAEQPALSTLAWHAVREASTRWYNGGTALQPLSPVLTSEAGTARLPAVAGAEHWLALHGPGHVPDVAGPFTAGAGTEVVRVVVARGATLRGRIGPPELLARLGTGPEIEALRPLMDARNRDDADWRATKLTVERAQEEQHPQHWQAGVDVAVQADGTFEHRGLPAGTYDVTLVGVLPHGLNDGQQLYIPLGRVQLVDGQATEISRDLPQLVPGRLRGRVLVNGEAYSRMEVALHAASKIGSLYLALDANGHFDAQLMPDSYRLQLPYRTRGTSNVGYWRSTETVSVEPGQAVDFTFAVRRVTAHVRILTAEGAPAPGLRVTMQTVDQPQGWTSWTTDDDGWIQIVPAPLGPFALLVAHPNPAQGLAAKRHGAAKDAWLGSLRVPDTGNEARFEERLPEGWR